VAKARDIMTADPCGCSTHDSIQDVARAMRDNDCGSIPIVDETSRRVVGTITDRDLVVRGLASAQGPDARVGDLMTRDVCCCGLDDELEDVERIMVSNQVRRVPVVDADGRLAGIIAQADLARAALNRGTVSEHEVAVVVERISEPGRPGRGRTADFEARL
jgi:CBS domain-containing protein